MNLAVNAKWQSQFQIGLDMWQRKVILRRLSPIDGAMMVRMEFFILAGSVELIAEQSQKSRGYRVHQTNAVPMAFMVGM